ncbi:DUF6573 family protein [Streptomyces sp. 4N509B]|uniref:DUF6573 family protein n=1 Tax=Streptomyces sp. 4N509B TaxID=3457413 RepID=UPI003FCEF206
MRDATARAHSAADGGGRLIAVDDETARQAGFRLPVALTAAAFTDCVAWSTANNERKGTCLDEAGRLRDVLAMVRFVFSRTRRGARDNGHAGGQRCVVQLYRVPRAGIDRVARRTLLTAQIGRAGEGEPVLTITLQSES